MKSTNNTIRNHFSKIMALAAGLSLTFAIPTTADAAVFAKFDGIDGESKDENHDKWIDVLAIDWGMHKPGGGATGQSRRRGGVIVEDMRLTMEYEKASPKLMEKCLMGEVIPKLEIEFVKTAGESRVTYLKIELTNVLITSTSFHHKERPDLSGAGQSESVPMEDFSLNFEEIKVTYTEYDKEGKKGGNVETTWKVEEGEAG